MTGLEDTDKNTRTFLEECIRYWLDNISLSTVENVLRVLNTYLVAPDNQDASIHVEQKHASCY